MSNENTVQLGDGRVLGYAEYGDPNGKPVFQFHGWCCSRLECGQPHIRRIAEELHARLIVVERPGMGLSTFKKGRRVLDWPDDVTEFADALGIDRFSVIGYSSGGPFALACATKIPERLAGVALISSDPPRSDPQISAMLDDQTRQFDRIADRAPWLFALMLRLNERKNGKLSGEQLFASLSDGELPDSDKEALSAPESGNYFKAILAEGMRNGPRGPAWDWALCARPWGFEPADVRIPVALFQGELDTMNKVATGRHLANALPSCNAVFYPDDGHASIFARRYPDILSSVID